MRQKELQPPRDALHFTISKVWPCGADGWRRFVLFNQHKALQILFTSLSDNQCRGRGRTADRNKIGIAGVFLSKGLCRTMPPPTDGTAKTARNPSSFPMLIGGKKIKSIFQQFPAAKWRQTEKYSPGVLGLMKFGKYERLQARIMNRVLGSDPGRPAMPGRFVPA